MLHKEVILRNIMVREGYEPTGEYREAKQGELWLGGSGQTVYRVLILRRIPQWRDPVLPADYGKLARFSDDGKDWIEGQLAGWYKEAGDDVLPWMEFSGAISKFCQVCDE